MKYLEILLAGSLSLASFAGAAFAAVVSFSPPTGQKIINKVFPPPLAKSPITPVQKSPEVAATPTSYSRYLQQQLHLVDQVPRHSDFWQFRQRLREAINAHNAQYIRNVADPNIKLTFAYPTTLENLDIDNSKSPFWAQMAKIFSQGCAQYSNIKFEEVWVCPAIFEHWNEQVGYNNKVAVLGNKVNVYSQPSSSSKIVYILADEAVNLAKTTSQIHKLDGWIKVILPTGNAGYVSAQHVYNQSEHAIFRKINGEWKMTYFFKSNP